MASPDIPAEPRWPLTEPPLSRPVEQPQVRTERVSKSCLQLSFHWEADRWLVDGTYPVRATGQSHSSDSTIRPWKRPLCDTLRASAPMVRPLSLRYSWTRAVDTSSRPLEIPEPRSACASREAFVRR